MNTDNSRPSTETEREEINALGLKLLAALMPGSSLDAHHDAAVVKHAIASTLVVFLATHLKEGETLNEAIEDFNKHVTFFTEIENTINQCETSH